MYFMRQSIIVMSRLIEFDLREAIYNHYSELDQTFYRGQTTGDLMSRITEDVSKVRMYLGPAILYAIDLAALIVLVVASMVKVDLTLSLLTLLPLPFYPSRSTMSVQLSIKEVLKFKSNSPN